MTPPPQESVWIGDLSGFQIAEDRDGDIALIHRCGADWRIDASRGAYLGNLIVDHVLPHRAEGCRGATT